MDGPREWSPETSDIDASAFDRGRIGPYRLGRRIRRTRSGTVVLGIQESDRRVAELELLDLVGVVSSQQRLLQEVNHVLGLEHRHLATVLGAGIADGNVYVARLHHMGRTLEDVMTDTPTAAPPDLGPGILYAVVEVLGFLEQQGPQPGSCSLGGFDARDVVLGYDGSIVVVGAGLRSLRDMERSTEADVASVHRLAEDLSRWLGLPMGSTMRASSSQDRLRALRQEYREACSHSRRVVGAFLRRRYSERLRNERSYFGLSTLH